jgi:surface antigen
MAPERLPRGVGDTAKEAFWRGVGGSHQGEPTLVAKFTNSSGEPCQELEHTVVVDGIHRRATAIVCERPDGHWVIATQTARTATN